MVNKKAVQKLNRRGQDEVIDLNPQPIRPKISYGDPINIEFKDKQKNPDEKPKIVKYEDPNIDLIPKIILKKDTVKKIKDMDESSYNYDALKSISKYMQKMEQEGDLYQHKSDFVK